MPASVQHTQNAGTRLAVNHENVCSLQVFYAKKHEQEQSKFKDKLKKAKDSEETKNQAQQQQNTVIEMMKMQMREAQARADAQLKEALDRAQSPSSVATDPEIYELRDELEKLENKLEDQALELEDKENENRRLGTCLASNHKINNLLDYYIQCSFLYKNRKLVHV